MSDDKSRNMARTSPSFQPNTQNTAIEDIRRMFVDEIQVPRIVNNKQTPAKRAAFAKTHGAVYGNFQIVDNLPPQYQLGIFQQGRNYSAWIRYSSDIAQTAPDLKSTVGIGIKLFDIPGRKSIEQEPESTTLDFILQNTEVFFASDAVDMANFKAAAISGNLDAFLVQNPELAAVLDSMDKRVDSLLTEPFWSCVPFKFGDNYCKFKLDAEKVPNPDNPPNVNDNNYLAQDLAQRLMNGEVRLNFYVQLRNNPDTQSIISARSLWDESEAVPVKVATLFFNRQNIKARQQQEYGESLSFNLWRTLAEMEPVGSIAEARKVTYLSSSDVRRNVNGQSIGEPVIPRAPRLIGQPAFTSDLETPWPKGTFENTPEDNPDNPQVSATENFQSSPPLTLKPGTYTTVFPEITISARDSELDVAINNYGILSNPSQMALMDKGITYVSFPHGSSSLRLLFEKHSMKEVSFDLIVINGNVGYDGLLKIFAYDDKTLITTFQTGEINKRITLQSPDGNGFNLLTFDNNYELFVFNLQNFEMTFA